MFSQIRSFFGLWNNISEQIEYWEDFKGEEIWIRSHSLGREDSGRSSFNQTTFIIKGTIDDVKSFPPGFLLNNVEEMVHMSDFEILFGAGTTLGQDIQGAAQSRETIRKIDQKFISFDSINEIERGVHVESAEEPFREEEL